MPNDLEQQIAETSDLSAYRENRSGLPSQTAFVSFIAARLRDNLPAAPTTVRLDVSRVAKHVFKISGTVTLDTRRTPIEGEIHWLPNLDCFRGHVIVEPQRRVNEMLSEETESIRALDWQQAKWTDEDHTHCILCMAAISSSPSDDGFDFGFTATNIGWLCPTCYIRVIVNGADHPWLNPE